jgi:hypothetical protein
MISRCPSAQSALLPCARRAFALGWRVVLLGGPQRSPLSIDNSYSLFPAQRVSVWFQAKLAAIAARRTALAARRGG